MFLTGGSGSTVVWKGEEVGEGPTHQVSPRETSTDWSEVRTRVRYEGHTGHVWAPLRRRPDRYTVPTKCVRLRVWSKRKEGEGPVMFSVSESCHDVTRVPVVSDLRLPLILLSLNSSHLTKRYVVYVEHVRFG